MPVEAIESGVETGTGTNFVLEAPAHVVEQFLESEQQEQPTHPASHGGHHRREGSATAATAPCIEGVVDLSAVSQLVEGIDDEGELTKFLRRDFAESRASAFASPSSAAAVDSTSAAADAAFPALQPTIANYATNLETIQEGMQNHVRPMTSDFDDYDTAANISTEQLSESAIRLVKSGTDDYLNEEKPLLPSSSSSSSPKDDILASSGSPASVGPSTACLVVSADPFVQTLADVLEHVDNNKPNSVKGSLTSSSIERTSELHNGSVRFSSYTHGDGDDAAAAANSFMLHHYPSSLEDIPGGGIAVSSEAFLISMPTTTTTTTSTAATATAVVDGMTGVESDYGIHGSNYSNHSSTEYKYNNNNTAESVYILALPEIVISSKTSNDDADGEDDAASSSRQHHGGGNRTLRSSVTSIANTIATVTAEEIVATPFFENAFAPLPTDIRNIELRVSTAATTAYYDDGYNEKEDGWRTSAEGDDAAGGNDEGDYPSVHLDVVVDRCVPFVGYVLLVAGLLGLSSSGVAFDLQHGPSAEMKTLWRFVATTIAFLCLGSKAMTREELEKFSLVDLVFWVPLASVNYGFMCTAFVVALEMTSMVNTFILSNLASLIIIGSKFATGSPVLLLEGLGAAVGFAGALICAGAPSTEPPVPIAGDPNDGVGDDADNLEMTGNILAFLASVATAIYLTIAKNLRPKVDLFLFMTLLFAYSSIFLLIYMLLSGQPVKILSFHPTIGLFGWLHPALDRLPLELYSALVCNGIGTAGFIAVMKYFDPVVVSMVMLMEPIFASFMGAATGVSTLPGWMTWLGDAVVVVGSIMVISSGAETTESIDATEALHGFEKGAAEDDAMVRGSTKSSLTRGSSLAKSPLEIRSVLSRRSGRYSMVGGGGGGRRAVVTTPRVFQSHSGEGVEEGGEGEVEFQSVKGKMRSSSIKSSGHRVVWN